MKSLVVSVSHKQPFPLQVDQCTLALQLFIQILSIVNCPRILHKIIRSIFDAKSSQVPGAIVAEILEGRWF